jgi:hypothetical protein
LRAARSAKSIATSSRGSLAQPAGQSASRLLQKRGPLGPIRYASNKLSPLAAGATLGRSIGHGFASVDPAAPVGKQPPLLAPVTRAERDGQQHILA